MQTDKNAARGGSGVGNLARSAMEKQDHRIGAILTLDGDPLLDAADLLEAGFVDRFGCYRGTGRQEGAACRQLDYPAA